MFSRHASKITIAFLSLSVLTIGFLVLWLSADLPKTKLALAVPGSIDQGWVPLRGYAWVGAPNACTGTACGTNPSPSWISFNYKDSGSGGYCVNSSGTPQSPNQTCVSDSDCALNYSCLAYWVAVNETTGKLDGYAWSDNVGWINFGLNDSDVPAGILPATCNGVCATGACGVCSCGACYNKTQRKFYGWARVLSEADNNTVYDTGWIRLGDLVISGADYGLTAIGENSSGDPTGNAPWGDLLGWSWNGANANIGSNSTSGLGWLSFNCDNPTAGGCANSAYKVTGRPDALGTLKITRIKGDESHGLNVDWSNGYPAYGATTYEVWRYNGQCYDNGQAIGEDCDTNAYCSRGTCNLGLPYEAKATTTSGYVYDDRPLNLYVTYKYIARSCNIFACAKTAAGSLQTSPIDIIGNFKATPICAATAGQPASYVDMAWGNPYIVSFSGVSVDHYELKYCQVGAGGRAGDCQDADWLNPAADCVTLGANKTSCREILNSASGRYQSKDFYVYRLRAVGDKGTCIGGDNDGKECPLNDCALGGGVCDLYKSSWAFSNNGNPFRICPVGTTYQEQRPQ